MDFTLPPEHEALRQQVRSFIAEEVLPLEADPANYDAHENIRIDCWTACVPRQKQPGCGRRRHPPNGVVWDCL